MPYKEHNRDKRQTKKIEFQKNRCNLLARRVLLRFHFCRLVYIHSARGLTSRLHPGHEGIAQHAAEEEEELKMF